MNPIARAALVFFLTTAAVAHGAEAPANPEEAAALRAEVVDKINAIGRRITEDRRRRDALSSALHLTEQRSADLARELGDIEARLATKRSHLTLLKRNRAARWAAISEQRLDLKRHIRAAYSLGRQDRLKLLLNQQDPAAVSRVFTYYEYFNLARARRIKALRTELSELKRIEAGIRQETAALEKLRPQKTAAIAAIEKQHARRREVIGKLDRRIREADTRLQRLREDERRLAELIERLQRELARLSLPPNVPEVPFPKLKGKLPWPIQGKILHRFGTPRQSGGLNRQGVVIAGKRGDPVRVIFPGRIAFSDWLRGFGFLVIVDHGGGYMSLYGHNEALKRKAGDWVQTGEIIATVGNSGGQAKTTLYFEIRRDGVPTNPLSWCTRPVEAALVSP
jgi:septal ring factor EnvC (AmiA/AmiB activator)